MLLSFSSSSARFDAPTPTCESSRDETRSKFLSNSGNRFDRVFDSPPEVEDATLGGTMRGNRGGEEGVEG